MFYYLINLFLYLKNLIQSNLTNIIEEELEKDEEREIIKEIMEKAYSRHNIKKFIEFGIEKDKLEQIDKWNIPVTFEKFNPIMKTLGLNEFAVLRSNLIYYER